MAEFTSDDVISKLRLLKLDYIQNSIGSDPARLPQHFSELLGYATLLYDHYATALKQYRETEAKVIVEENAARDEFNKGKGLRERMTVDEKNDRIALRISTLKARKEYLEQEVKGATLHINGCQSLMKNWSDESKGIR